jgi:outer membrane receptor protein involved in Fe transport
MKYDLNDKNILRLGVSKTYTLPQSKEISPYQYVNISFVSQGDPHIKPSDNYNLDLKWEFYPSASELISLTGFYKHIKHPIARVDEGNSAGLLTYTNISDYATVAGMELEIRKNLLNVSNADHTKLNKLTAGFNASYTYSNLEVQIANTNPKNTQLEGAAPFLTNFDVSYQLQNQERVWMTSLVFNYFSKRIHTIGSRTFKDIIEEGVPTMDFVSSYKFNKHLSVKFKWMNVLNPSYKLTRKSSTSNDKVILNEFKKGQNLSLGVSYEL